MILTEKKRDMEIKIFEREVYEELQSVYRQDKFLKYVNEENYETFTSEGKEYNVNNLKLFEVNNNANCKDTKKTGSLVVYKNMNTVMSFKSFVGKQINIETEDRDQVILGKEKIKRLKAKKWCTNDCYEISQLPTVDNTTDVVVAKSVLERIDQIRNDIVAIRRTIQSTVEINKIKETYLTSDNKMELFLDFNQLCDKLNEIITFAQLSDPQFLSNIRLHRYINNCVPRGKNMNIFEVIRMLKKEKEKITKKSDDYQMEKTYMKILNYNNYVSFRKNIMCTQFERLREKVNQYDWLLTEPCFLLTQEETTIERESKAKSEHSGQCKSEDRRQCKSEERSQCKSVGHILLSLAMFINLCINDNMIKRIMNYIYLDRMEVKKCKQYIENVKKAKSMDMLHSYVQSLTKGVVPRAENPSAFFEEVIRIHLTEDNEKVLDIYKRLINNELSVDLMLREMEHVNQVLEQMCQKLEGREGVIKNWTHLNGDQK
ncbi:hypothetical protein, conserved [Plasmodium gonderi]|uniref:Uncharacterized protein n=1 Tax=Plasmodium gonderi TaxID=77519 RepID=A0A1Y1JDR4_PLAGO|nr:hypothetical protein, conserved [Plasmodium gonderi]GAW80626.1 hypothetical protein, conserved [Plasmodium gonderi]